MLEDELVGSLLLYFFGAIMTGSWAAAHWFGGTRPVSLWWVAFATLFWPLVLYVELSVWVEERRRG